jgi:hypothetical protein
VPDALKFLSEEGKERIGVSGQVMACVARVASNHYVLVAADVSFYSGGEGSSKYDAKIKIRPELFFRV